MIYESGRFDENDRLLTILKGENLEENNE